MPYFVETIEGVFELVEEEFSVDALDTDVIAAYVVSEKYSRSMTFKGEALTPKKERRFRCKDGQLRLKAEMGPEDLEFLKAKMARTRAARKGAAE